MSAGIAHLGVIESIHERIRAESSAFLNPCAAHCELIGLSMKALYEISTCSRGCPGGDHTSQYLAARSYNLCSAAFSMLRIAYYDEALNHVRSLGELANLLSLFWTDPTRFERWKTLPDRARQWEYRPVAVRKTLGESGSNLLMDDNTYRSLCELATHVTPNTRPNLHNNDSRPIVGGIPQIDGATRVLEHLAQLSTSIAIGYSMQLDFTDIEQQLLLAAQSVDGIEIE